MDPLLVMAAPDGSSLIVSENAGDPRRPFRLVFEHQGHGAPVPVHGHFCALWVTIDGRQHVLFAGDTLDDPDVDRVQVEWPDHTESYPVRSFRHNPRVWMSTPEPFQPGMVVAARWLGGDRTLHHEQTPPLEWGIRMPDIPEPPPPDYQAVPSPLEDPTGWTGYSPR
jgi:hypothetical protein